MATYICPECGGTEFHTAIDYTICAYVDIEFSDNGNICHHTVDWDDDKFEEWTPDDFDVDDGWICNECGAEL